MSRCPFSSAVKRGMWACDPVTGYMFLYLKDAGDLGNNDGDSDVVIFRPDGTLAGKLEETPHDNPDYQCTAALLNVTFVVEKTFKRVSSALTTGNSASDTRTSSTETPTTDGE